MSVGTQSRKMEHYPQFPPTLIILIHLQPEMPLHALCVCVCVLFLAEKGSFHD